VSGFENAAYKAFLTLELAQDAFNNQTKSQTKGPSLVNPIVPTFGICVDAAYSSATNAMEYRGVLLPDRKLLFSQGPFYDATNNVGEFLAVVHALALCKQKGWEYNIYSDSKTALAWVKKKKANTKLLPSERNSSLFELLERANKWLIQNNYSNALNKWETEAWGEIPADYGRK
jgi:ribonuclease HI